MTIQAERTYTSRKFMFAVFFTLTGSAALMIDKMTGGEWVMLAGLVIGLYAAGSVAEKAVTK